MHSDLILAKEFLFDKLNYRFSDFEAEAESKEYAASSFLLDDKKIKFRVAKITPTKVGAFVTLWKRNGAGITCPHDESDPFDFYIISVRKDDRLGQFVFPKSSLIKQKILSSAGIEGKRGFRVYASWDRAENKQALKTQKWQSEFFMEINNGKDLDIEQG